MAKLQQALSNKQTHHLELRPKMLQSLKLLAMPLMELDVHIKEEMIANPMLEINEETDENKNTNEEKVKNIEEIENTENNDLKKTVDEAKELSEILDQWNDYHSTTRVSRGSQEEQPNPENFIKAREDKKDDYLLQLEKMKLPENEYDFALDLIDSTDGHGYLLKGLSFNNLASEYEIDETRAEEIHQIILHLEPKGITARNYSECLIAQLTDKQLQDFLLVSIIKEDFDDLIHRRYQLLVTKYKVSLNMILSCKNEIATLDPKPGLRLQTSQMSYIVPDVIIKKIENKYEVIVNDFYIPNIMLSSRYKSIIASVKNEKQALDYVRGKINSAKFLIKSMYMRNRTLERVTRSIIQHQKKYFYDETGVLEPLIYSVIANELQVNESTICRVVRTKYADTPFGIMCLKDFFTSTAGKDKNYEAVSRQLVEREIINFVENEDKNKPISDQNIANTLKEKGISVSRRVIAKYREGLGVLNSRLRRKE